MEFLKKLISSITGLKLVPLPQRVEVITLTDDGLELAKPEVIKGMMGATNVKIDQANAVVAKRTIDLAVLSTILDYHGDK